MKNILFFIIYLLFASTTNINAQIDTSYYDNILFKSAIDNIDNMHYLNAIEDLTKFRAIPSFNKDARSLQLLADCYWKVRKYKESKLCYDTLVGSNIDLSVIERFHLAELSAMNGNYTMASFYLKGINGFKEKLNGYNNVSSLYNVNLGYSISTSQNIIEQKIFPVFVNDSLIWMNEKQIISGTKHVILADYFLENKKINLNNITNSTFPDLSYYSYSLNTGRIYFTIFRNFLDKKKSVSNDSYLKIAESKLNGSKVSEIKMFTLGDGDYSMIQPLINDKGNVLIFISNYNDNQFDLYYSKKSEQNGYWSKPSPISILNTIGDEVFPSFGKDGYLYFSSNGRAGMGGLDIYKVNLKIFGGDDKIIHMPSPINSRYDDYDFNNSIDTLLGTFISHRDGDDNRYAFIYKEPIPELNNLRVNESDSAPKGLTAIVSNSFVYSKTESLSIDSIGKRANQNPILPALNKSTVILNSSPISSKAESVRIDSIEKRTSQKPIVTAPIKSTVIVSSSPINSKTESLSIDSIGKRANQKPILVYTKADSITISLYDNGTYDKDTVSIIYNNVMVVAQKEISTDEKKPVSFSFKLNEYPFKNEIIIVANNLGAEPPNSALIISTDSFKKQYFHYVSTDLLNNAVIQYFKSK